MSAPIELTIDAKEPMFNHFDMTSNLGDDSVSNDLLHICLSKHVVACKFDACKVHSPMLGWFNDEHWSKNKHGDDGMRKGNKNGVTSDDFRTLKYQQF